MATNKEPAIMMSSARFVTVELCGALTGLSPAAIRKRIERGQFLEGKEWRRGPDDRIWMDMRGLERWVDQQPLPQAA